jgi:serine/threonine-protein kinase
LSDPSGEKLGKYELIKPLGAGGMAEVFLARTEGMAGFLKLLVIKRVLPELKDDLEFIEMFFDEARLAARLSHPNICQVFDLGEAHGVPFIAMEYVPGQSLNGLMVELLERKRPMPLPALLRVSSQLLEALHYAHTLNDEQNRPLNLIHRDVTPSNIMVTPQGSLKLLDFGIARAATRRHRTQAGMTVGKMGYMAPEQLRSDHLDQRVDFFGVGVTMYVMATGRLPFERGTPGEILRKILVGEYLRPEELRPDMPADLSRITQKAMAPAREDRYGSALEFLLDLERCASGAGLSMGPHTLIDLMARSSVGTQSLPALLVPMARPPPEPKPTMASRASPPGLRPTLKSLEPLISTSESDTDESGAMPNETVVAKVIPPPLPHAPPAALTQPAGIGVRTFIFAVMLVMLAGGVGGVLVATRMTGEREGLPAPVPITRNAPLSVPEAAPEAKPSEVEAPPADEKPLAEAKPAEETTPAAEPKPAADTKPVAVAPKPAAPRRPPAKSALGATGTLKVTSGKQATIRILGHDLGKTPMTLHLPVGTHRIELVYPGQPPVASTVVINADAETTLNGEQ